MNPNIEELIDFFRKIIFIHQLVFAEALIALF